MNLNQHLSSGCEFRPRHTHIACMHLPDARPRFCCLARMNVVGRGCEVPDRPGNRLEDDLEDDVGFMPIVDPGKPGKLRPESFEGRIKLVRGSIGCPRPRPIIPRPPRPPLPLRGMKRLLLKESSIANEKSTIAGYHSRKPDEMPQP